MRGKQGAAAILYGAERNIPAYAGKTARSSGGYAAWPEHPRVCGENLHSEQGLHDIAGTSPRMRGKHKAHVIRLRAMRNIPAYAGKTCEALRWRRV